MTIKCACEAEEAWLASGGNRPALHQLTWERHLHDVLGSGASPLYFDARPVRAPRGSAVAGDDSLAAWSGHQEDTGAWRVHRDVARSGPYAVGQRTAERARRHR